MNAKRDRGNRQLEVFRLIGEGKTMKEIGNELHLSPKTVEVHRSHIREKLRISSFRNCGSIFLFRCGTGGL